LCKEFGVVFSEDHYRGQELEDAVEVVLLHRLVWRGSKVGVERSLVLFSVLFLEVCFGQQRRLL